MKSFKQIFENKIVIRIITLIFFIVILYSLKDIINLVLFTFIFIVLMGKLQTIVSSWVNRAVSKKVIVVFIYLLIALFLTLVLYKYLPIIIEQFSELVRRLMSIDQLKSNNKIIKYIINYLSTSMGSNFKFLYKYLSSIGQVAVQLFMALLLSLFYLLGKDHIAKFTAHFKTSLLGEFFTEIEFFGQRFVNSFGKVIEVQFLISIINACLTTIVLWLLGFPQLLGLGIMIFFLGLIPVAGVIISLLPLSIIAYSIGGTIEILYVFILILCVHSLESYVLNPKLMSVKTHLPVFYTFTVLIISEHFFGIWGLILGIPIFIFILDLIGVVYNKEDKLKSSKKNSDIPKA